MYDLGVQGFTGFARFGRALQQTAIARDPLTGLVDGVNRTFFTNYAPILTSGSLAVWVNAVSVPGTYNADTGEVTLTTPPLYPPVASYTFTPYTATQILQFLIGGFQVMEGEWWGRDWKLVDGAGAFADETSANLYVADKNGTDPVCGSFTFATSWAQISFYLACVNLHYLRTTQQIKAGHAYMWRETVRGMTVDQSRLPGNLAVSVEQQERAVARALANAQDQVYPGGDHYGGFIADPVTLDYASNWDWQTISKEQDWNELIGYHYPIREFR